MSQTYAKMIFELCIIQWYKADMAKHGEYALFLPWKFEKNEKSVKFWIHGDLNPRLLGGSQVCKPLDHKDLYVELTDIIVYECMFIKCEKAVLLWNQLLCIVIEKPALESSISN